MAGLVRVSVLGLAIASALGSVAVAADLGAQPATSAFNGPGVVLVTLVAGLSLVAAGTAANTHRSTRWMAIPVVLAGMVWLAPLWVAWPASPGFVRSVATLAAPFLVPLLGHLVLRLPGGPPSPASGRRLLLTLYAAAAAVAMAHAFFFDPFLDLAFARPTAQTTRSYWFPNRNLSPASSARSDCCSHCSAVSPSRSSAAQRIWTTTAAGLACDRPRCAPCHCCRDRRGGLGRGHPVHHTRRSRIPPAPRRPVDHRSRGALCAGCRCGMDVASPSGAGGQPWQV